MKITETLEKEVLNSMWEKIGGKRAKNGLWSL